jgi:N-acetylglucosamine-6-phosphate deacetylase
MTALDEYGQAVVALLRAAFDQGRPDREAVAAAVADTIRAGGAVHVFGCGHSQLVALDVVDRAGGLRGVRALVDDRLSPLTGPPGGELEQRPDEAAPILDRAGLAGPDLLVVVSHSGVNPLPVEMAREASSRGHTVVAVTSRAHASAVDVRHPGRRRLHEIADLTIDTLAPLGDAAVELDTGARTGPMSTVLAVALVTATLARAAELLADDGAAHTPVRSRNIPETDRVLDVELLVTGVRLPSLHPGRGAGWLAVSGGKVVAHGLGKPTARAGVVVDGAGGALLPGFVDVHVHGADGHDTMDADPDSLRAIARFHARHGVTALLPTTWAASPDATAEAVRAVAETHGPVPGGATILGVHLEGPWLQRGRCGAQDPDAIRDADPAEVDALLDTGAVRLVTVAPEVPANRYVLEACRARGVTASIGHTDADHDTAAAAISHGVRHATHCFNAMRGFDHRRPGTVGAVLTDPRVRCELVADNVHVHPTAIRMLFAAKGPEGVVLVSDAVEVTGLPEGAHEMGGRPVDVAGSAVRLADGSLAGSVLTLDAALRNVVAATGLTLDELWPATSRNAAAAAGVADRKGHVEVGADADLVVLDDRHRVVVTVIGGQIVHDARGTSRP